MATNRKPETVLEERTRRDIQLYRQLWRVRLFDRAVSSLHRQNKILGGVYSGEWQEAIPVGFCHFLDESDVVFPLHRDLGVFLARGVDPGVLIAQFMGRRDGLSGGRDSFLHAGDLERGVIGATSMLGSTLPVAVGAALRFKMLDESSVAVAFFGEGATARGDFHEALNFAGIHHLPVVFVCENNFYAYSTPMSLEMPVETVAERAAAYGMRGVRCNGQDLNRVLDVAEAAIDRARKREGPALVECLTYRHHGHSEHDPARYRPEDELAEWAGRDPIQLFELYLKNRGQDVAALAAEIKLKVEEEIDRAIAFAEASPLPSGEEALRHVFYEGVPLPARVSIDTSVLKRADAEAGGRTVEAVAGGARLGAPASSGGAKPEGHGGAAGPLPGELPRLPAATETTSAEAVSYLDAIRQALDEEMERDPAVFILGEDVGRLGGAFGATRGLFEKHGASRVIDTPISESLIVGASVGAAVLGLRPVAEMQFADFISCGFDQVVNTAATFCYRHGGRARVPMVIRLPAGARIHGGLFHSQNPESFFLSTPGLKIVAAGTVEDAKGLLKSAIRDDNPVLFLEYKSLYRRAKAVLPAEELLTPIGQAAVRMKGEDLTIVTYGPLLSFCLEAAEALRAEGASAEVIDLRTLRPLDLETVARSIQRTGKILVAHEDRRFAGVGAEIAARIAEELFEFLDAPVLRVTSADTPYAFSPPLEEFILPDTAKILAAARKLLSY